MPQNVIFFCILLRQTESDTLRQQQLEINNFFFFFEGGVIQNVLRLTGYNFKETSNSLCDLYIMMYMNKFLPTCLQVLWEEIFLLVRKTPTFILLN